MIAIKTGGYRRRKRNGCHCCVACVQFYMCVFDADFFLFVFSCLFVKCEGKETQREHLNFGFFLSEHIF